MGPGKYAGCLKAFCEEISNLPVPAVLTTNAIYYKYISPTYTAFSRGRSHILFAHNLGVEEVQNLVENADACGCRSGHGYGHGHRNERNKIVLAETAVRGA